MKTQHPRANEIGKSERELGESASRVEKDQQSVLEGGGELGEPLCAALNVQH